MLSLESNFAGYRQGVVAIFKFLKLETGHWLLYSTSVNVFLGMGE